MPRLAEHLLAQRSYNMHLSRQLRIIAALYCVVCSFAAWAIFPPAACLAFSFGTICMAGLLVCDMQARILPTELVALLLACATVFRLAMGTPLELAEIAVPACALAGLCVTQNELCRHFGKSELIGMGDIRAFVPLAIFSGIDGSFYGIMACALIMGAISIALILLGRARLSGHIAMAPGLAAWLLIGTIAPYIT